jgi:hypothetical protein
MRSIIATAALVSATGVPAQSPADVAAAVFVERSGEHGLRLEPAERLLRGDRVVTVLSWRGPQRAGYTITSAVPARLSLESTSRADVEISTDGGRRWSVLGDTDRLPRGITHLRWQAALGEGKLSYRAVVR